MTSNQLATTDTTDSIDLEVADHLKRGTGVIPRDVVDLMKDQIVGLGHNVTDAEFAGLLIQSGQRGLSLLNGQMWGIVRRENVNGQWKQVLQPQVGIAGLRLIAQRTKRYGGVISTEWCGEDGVWREFWPETVTPAAARVRLLRTDHDHPVQGIAFYSESVQTKRDGSPNKMWSERGRSMLAKCAEAAALRAAFPEELADVSWSQNDDGGSSVAAEVQRVLHAGDVAKDIAAHRGQMLKAAGDAHGLDRDAIVQILEDAGLGRPDGRVLGDDSPRGAARFQAMLTKIEEYRPDDDVIDAEDEDTSHASDASGDTDPDNHQPTDGEVDQADLFGDDEEPQS